MQEFGLLPLDAAAVLVAVFAALAGGVSAGIWLWRRGK